MVQFIEQPFACVLSDNPVPFTIHAVNATTGVNIYPKIELTFHLKVYAQRFFKWEFNNPITGALEEVRFHAIENPNADGYEVPGYLGNQAPDATYMESMLQHMQANATLNTFYNLSLNGFVITATAKEAIADLIPTNWYLSDDQQTGGSYSIMTSTSSLYYAAEKTEGHRVTYSVYLEKEYLSGNFELVSTQQNEVDEDGNLSFDVSSILHSEIENAFTEPPLAIEILPTATNKASKANVLRRYYVEASERWSNMPVAQSYEQSSINYAHFGGVSLEDYAYQNPIIALCNSQAFLCNWPSIKRVYPEQKDWLAWMNVLGKIATVTLKAKVWFTDGTNSTITIGSATLNPWETVRVPVGLEQVNLLNLFALPIKKWVVSVEDNAAAGILLATQTYLLTDYTNTVAQEFVYLNGYNIPASFMALGYKKESFAVSKEMATKTLNHNYKVINGQSFVFVSNAVNTYNVRSGHLTNIEAQALKAMLSVKAVFLSNENGYKPVIIEPDSFETLDEESMMQSLQFSAIESMQVQSYSTNKNIAKLAITNNCGVFTVGVDTSYTIENYGVFYVKDEDGNNVETIATPTNNTYTLSNAIELPGKYFFSVAITINGEIHNINEVVFVERERFTFLTPNHTSFSNFVGCTLKSNAALNVYGFFEKEDDYEVYNLSSATNFSLYKGSLPKGKKQVSIEAVCLKHIDTFWIEAQDYTNFQLNQLSGLKDLRIQNCNLEGHLNLFGLNTVENLFLDGNDLTGLTLGFMPNIHSLAISNNPNFSETAFLEVLKTYHKYKDLYQTPYMHFIVAQNLGTPSGSYSTEVYDIINGTGQYAGNGLAQANINVVI